MSDLDSPWAGRRGYLGGADGRQEREGDVHPNEKTLRDLDEAQLRGDIGAFGGFFTDDVVVHIPGKSSLAGEYRGKDQFLEVFGRFTQAVPGYSFERHAYLADDEHGVGLQRSQYKGGNQTIDSNDAFVCHFSDGKISEFWLLSEKSDEVDALIG
jgi:ketosteroid isomerase-like protein